MKKLLFLLLFSLFAFSSLFSCGKRNYSDCRYDLFDTFVQIDGTFESEEEFEEISSLVYDTLYYYSSLLNAYEDCDMTNLKTVNESGGETLEINGDLYDFLLFLKDTEKKTDGACAPSMGTVTAAWKSFINGESDTVPTTEFLKQCASHADFDTVILQENPYRVTLSDPELRIDAGAVAKGWAADRLKEVLKQHGVENLLVNLGGNVIAIGSNGNLDWNIGIKNPDGGIFTAVEVCDMSVVTSGVYERGRLFDGILYHHIISPEMLFPPVYYVSVTVISPSSAEADMLSTALFVLPYEESEELLKKFPDACAMWVCESGERYYSDNFPTK